VSAQFYFLTSLENEARKLKNEFSVWRISFFNLFTKMKNKFRVVHFSNSLFSGKLKNENELHKIRFSFCKEV